MAKTYDLLVRARGETKDAERAMKQLVRSVDNAGKRMKNTGRLMTTAISAPLAMLAGVGLKEAIQTRAVGARTDAVIKSMGETMKVTKREVEGLARELEMYSAIEADVIQSSENIALSFGALASNPKLFRETMTAAVDMSAALDQSVQTSVVQLGKAMQNGAKGAAALGKNGTLAKDDIEKLQKMAKDGVPIWEQQEYILEAVNKQYHGQGKNVDPIKSLWLAVKQIAETLATRLLPIVDDLSLKLQMASVWVSQLSPEMQNLIGIGALAAISLGPVVWALGSMVSIGSALIPVLLGITFPMVAVGAAVIGLGAALVIAYTKSERFRDVVNRSFTAVANAVRRIVASLRLTIDQWIDWARAAWERWGDDIMRVVRPVVRMWKTLISNGLANIRDILLAGLAALRGDWEVAGDLIKGVIDRQWRTIKSAFKDGTEANKQAIKLMAKAIKGMGHLFADAGKALGKALVNAVKDYIKNHAFDASSLVSLLLPPGTAGAAASQIAEAAKGKGRAGKGGKGASSGVNALGQLFGANVSIGQVMRYAAASSGQAYSVSTNTDGTQSVAANSVVVKFLQDRVAENNALLKKKIVRRTTVISALATLAAEYNKLKREKGAAVRAKKPKVAATKGKAMSANLEKRFALRNELDDLNTEIVSLGGQIQSDNESLIPPTVDNIGVGEQDARAAENLRREALGLQSVEEEERLQSINAIRAANGLPAVGSTSEITRGALATGSRQQGSNWQPLVPSSVSALAAVSDAARRALTGGTNITINSNSDPEAIAQRVAFILASNRLRAGGAF